MRDGTGAVPYWHQVPGRHVTDAGTRGFGAKALERDVPVLPHQDPIWQSVTVEGACGTSEEAPLIAVVAGKKAGLGTGCFKGPRGCKDPRGRAAIITLGFSFSSAASNLSPSSRNGCRGCC